MARALIKLQIHELFINETWLVKRWIEVYVTKLSCIGHLQIQYGQFSKAKF